jgi:23S rRNA pseudouridine1911/1915/1917 synthase
MSDKRTLTVPGDLDGVRADRVLAIVGGMSRRKARDLIEAGSVTVDGVAVAKSTPVAAGRTLEFSPPPAHGELVAEDVPFGVLADFGDVVVVDKPAGVVVHPGAGNEKGTLVAGLVARFPELRQLGEEARWGLVHRLDRDTSGVLLVAKTADMHRFLQGELRERRIKRTYLALVVGRLEAATGTIDAPIGRDPFRATRMTVTADGRPSRTHFRRLAEWDDVTLVEVNLETGRTHQIRVHFTSIDHSIVGDTVYGTRSPDAADPGRTWLHAARIEFPRRGRMVGAAEAPLPQDLRLSLERLGTPVTGSADV